MCLIAAQQSGTFAPVSKGWLDGVHGCILGLVCSMRRVCAVRVRFVAVQLVLCFLQSHSRVLDPYAGAANAPRHAVLHWSPTAQRKLQETVPSLLIFCCRGSSVLQAVLNWWFC